MPQLPTAPQNLDDPALNAQRAAFIAVLAENEGIIGKGWNNRTSEIAGFAMAMRNEDFEYDAETRREFCVIMEAAAQDLRSKHDEIQLAAMLLSGVSVPRYVQAVDLRRVMEATSYKKTLWSEPNPAIASGEFHVSVILSALVHHGLRLSQESLRVSVEREGDNFIFVFRGDIKSTYFTDPDEWFTINTKRGSESIRLFLTYQLALFNGGRVWVETANKAHFDYRLRLPITPNHGTYVDE